MSEKENEDLIVFMKTLSGAQSPEVQTYGFIPAGQVIKTTAVVCNFREPPQHVRREHKNPSKLPSYIHSKKQRVNGVTHIPKSSS